MFLIQALICFYNRHPHLDLLENKVLFMAYTRKATFNIDGITIHSSLFIPLNCKDLPSSSLQRLDNLVKKYDEISLIGIITIKFIEL
jgi:hypothetical protein